MYLSNLYLEGAAATYSNTDIWENNFLLQYDKMRKILLGYKFRMNWESVCKSTATNNFDILFSS